MNRMLVFSRRPLTKNKQQLLIFLNKSIIIWRPGVSRLRYSIIVHPIDECMHVFYIVRMHDVVSAPRANIYYR